MPCNNVERAVVSGSVHMPSMMYCVRVIPCIIYHILEISGFFHCIIIVIIIIIIIVIIIIIIVVIIKHFY